MSLQIALVVLAPVDNRVHVEFGAEAYQTILENVPENGREMEVNGGPWRLVEGGLLQSQWFDRGDQHV